MYKTLKTTHLRSVSIINISLLFLFFSKYIYNVPQTVTVVVFSDKSLHLSPPTPSWLTDSRANQALCSEDSNQSEWFVIFKSHCIGLSASGVNRPRPTTFFTEGFQNIHHLHHFYSFFYFYESFFSIRPSNTYSNFIHCHPYQSDLS